MLKENLCIESALMHLSVLYREPDAKEVKLDPKDYDLINSLAKQVSKKIALTDRQYDLAKQKVLHYADQFDDGLDIELIVNTLKYPIREIDRSRWIKVVERNGVPCLAVRFVFQKKLISRIEAIKSKVEDNTYEADEKTHYFPLTELSVYTTVSEFKDANFDIDPMVLDYYNKLQQMIENKKNYIPGIYGLSLQNLKEKNLNYAISSVGEPSIDNLSKFYDRKEHFGLHHFDQSDLESSLRKLTPLARKIVERKTLQVQIDPRQYTVENLAEVVLELDRFPLLISLNENTCYDDLIKFHKAFNGIILNESCSVMFRLSNTDNNANFNKYIKDNNLNNWVDSKTKIVYINNSKLPKPLLKSDWIPSAAITTYSGFTATSKVENYLESLDLVMHYDKDSSVWKRKRIEKI